MRLRLVLPVVTAVLAAGLSGCDDVTAGSPEHRETTWQVLPDLPGERRAGPVLAWTGTEVLAVGGDPGAPCPPTADCAVTEPMSTDAAALDLGTGTWRTIADAPLPVPAYAGSAYVAGRLFVQVEDRILSYDVAGDAWSTLPRKVAPWLSLEADGRRLLLVSGSDETGTVPDLLYDVPTGRWSRLPDDPIGPAYDREITPTKAGLVLTAKELVDNPGGGDRPSLVLAAVLDRTTDRWRRLPDSDLLGGWGWSAVGEHLVNPDLGGSDGGGPAPGDYGRLIPNGGVLDPATGTWSALPHAPKEFSGGWPVAATGSELIAASGYVYDDAFGTWTSIHRPDGAPESAGPAVWAGRTLVVIGGIDHDRGFSTKAIVTRSWSWEPVTAPQQ